MERGGAPRVGGTTPAYRRLMLALKSGMHEGAKAKIFTPMHYWLARKPA